MRPDRSRQISRGHTHITEESATEGEVLSWRARKPELNYRRWRNRMSPKRNTTMAAVRCVTESQQLRLLTTEKVGGSDADKTGVLLRAPTWPLAGRTPCRRMHPRSIELMTTVTRTFMVDDIDGSQDDVGTVQIALDHVSYEIDLSAANAERLREKLARFVENGKKVNREGTAHQAPRRTRGAGR